MWRWWWGRGVTWWGCGDVRAAGIGVGIHGGREIDRCDVCFLFPAFLCYILGVKGKILFIYQYIIRPCSVLILFLSKKYYFPF